MTGIRENLDRFSEASQQNMYYNSLLRDSTVHFTRLL